MANWSGGPGEIVSLGLRFRGGFRQFAGNRCYGRPRLQANGPDPMPDPIHADCFLPGTDTIAAPLVLLHGSGGNEFDLMPLASELAPKAAKLGIRGSVATDGGYAFFHRFPDRRVDAADIEAKAPMLAEFIETSRARYNFARRSISIGFPNGPQPCCWPILTYWRGRSWSARSPRSRTISRTAWTVRRC